PERQIRKSDPTGGHSSDAGNCCQISSPARTTCYRAQSLATMAAFVRRSSLAEGKFSFAFQSRLGRYPWLRPYTDLELIRLAENGVKKLLVICPSFVADCLETLEEIQIRGRDSFLAAGGSELTLIPCLNEHPLWVDALHKMIEAHLSGVKPGQTPKFTNQAALPKPG